VSPRADGKRHTFSDVIHERTNFDFVGRSWRWALLSGSVIVICLLALGIRGLNLGIDFTGGTFWDVRVEGPTPSADDVRDTLRPLGLAEAQISFREDRNTGATTLHVESEERQGADRDEVSGTLETYGQISQVNEVGSTWGDEVSEKALRALLIFFVIIAFYLWFRFEWKMSVAAIAAVVHDIIVTAGVYAITGFEVTPATVVAFLTILGFSLYDTVVVFDKIKENAAALGTVRGDTYSLMVNRSMNQVLMRSLNTSFVALLPVGSLLVVGSGFFGAVALRDFALALFIGLLTGAYSSIFVATPILAWLKEREPRYRALKARSTTAVATAPASPALQTASEEPVDDGAAVVTTATPGAETARPSAPRPPRPRQQRRRKRR
jgi:preprotein translocase subunit SecF